ncbi:MAG TPA: AAA family ATPase [Actinocrinis sp.]|nr:AAA family ATPase [Actinocrinis sp.]
MSDLRPPSLAAREIRMAAREALGDGPGLLLVGPAGIGKSHLLNELLGGAGGGARVLRCSPVEAELPLPFMCLIDLLEPVTDEEIARLPVGLRDALRAALLRADGESADPNADGDAGGRVHLAVLTLLRALTVRTPVWIVVDDLQWMDEPTAGILGFVARRAAGLRMRFLATERVAAGQSALHAGLCPAGTVELAVPPMTAGDLAAMLEQRAGSSVPPSTAREIHRIAQGNPLYALELLRALPADGRSQAPGDGVPGLGVSGLAVPGLLRSLLLNRLRTLPEEVRDTLTLASAASRPDLTLLATAGGEAATTHLETAERLGVIRIGADGHVEFDHPLVRAAVYSEATGRARREAHRRLAETAGEPVERARHLALANPAQGEEVAAMLLDAARSARRRGAPATAAELAGLAVARTPADARAERLRRQLLAAQYAADAGRWDDARRDAAAVLAEESDPATRVHARIVLLTCSGQALESERPLVEEGLAEARATGDPVLEARMRTWSATRHILAGRIGEATSEAVLAAKLAEQSEDVPTRVETLTDLAYLQRIGGDGRAEATLAQALDTAERGGMDDIRLWEALYTQAIFNLHDNRLALAEEQILAMLARFGDLVGVEDLLRVQIPLTDVRVRAGDCAGALQAARRAVELHEDLDGTAGPAVYALAAAESYGGSLERARTLAQEGVRLAEQDGDQFWAIWNLTVLGRVHLMGDDPARAAAVLREVRLLERTMGIVDPAVGRWHADLAEALVGEGALDEAREFIAATAETARRLGRAGTLATLDRAEALRRLALGELSEAAVLLTSAATVLRSEGLPLELARTLIALAEVERRRRRQAAARRASQEAARLCEAAGAAAWLGRIEQRSRGAGESRGRGEPAPALTPSELRIATLAADGATNREIAAACYLSVKTVEASLSRVYRKLAVRSRTELAKTLPEWVERHNG